jgi:hypothetical protein
LYPPHTLSQEVVNEEVFMKLAPYQDDAWLKALSLLKGTQCKKVCLFCPNYIKIRGVQKRSLSKINLPDTGVKGDEQIRMVFEYYNLYRLI